MRTSLRNAPTEAINGYQSLFTGIKACFNTVISFLFARVFHRFERIVGDKVAASIGSEKIKSLQPKGIGATYSGPAALIMGKNRATLQVDPSVFRKRMNQVLQELGPRHSFARIDDVGQMELNLMFEHSRASFREQESEAKACALKLADHIKGLNSKLVAVPCGVRTLGGGHFVSILVDMENGWIEYYDSQGTHPSQKKMTSFPQVTCGDFLSELAHALGDQKSFKVKLQTGQHQTDTYNCVLYGTRFFEERAKGRSYEELMGEWSTLAKEGKSLASIASYRGMLYQASSGA